MLWQAAIGLIEPYTRALPVFAAIITHTTRAPRRADGKRPEPA